ncbi:MAG TPA: undecaprenyl-diphosphate phosphatase [Anaerolineaceae bacterium]|nr:undecaprenyl-diphosphate phosphatase [Anaerolineaceae bacterium]HPN50114.1 undecaprenyl-diphosphate phosphatase [Anaerolineaceae bacterium]
MNIIMAIVLGIFQGLTEFIPVSSSAHLIIVPWLLNWTDPVLTSLEFDISLHVGTLAAVIAFFYRDLWRLFLAGVASLKERKIGDDRDRKLAWMLVIGSIPGAIIGVLAESKIEELFHAPGEPPGMAAMVAMGVIIAILGGLLFWADRIGRQKRGLEKGTFKDALLIGLAQALAIFPGVSRSGATITAGLGLGLKREDAARFSFLLSTPIILGGGLKSLVDIVQMSQESGFSAGSLGVFAAGMLAAGIAGFFCIKYLLRFLQKHSTDVFAYYRWGLAAVVIIAAILKG